MELQHLKEFVVLERIRNYSLAADELYTTEATLSRHIKALEKELANSLFVRTTRRVELTEFGQKFLMYAMQIVQTMEECETNLLNAPSHNEKTLMIGIFGMINSYNVILRALDLLSEEHAEYIVGTIQGDVNDQKEKLKNGEYNLAIVRESSGDFDDQFERLTILKEPLCVVISKEDPLAKEKTVDISLLKNRNITMPSEHMIAYKLLAERCRECGFEPTVTPLLRERGKFLQNIVSIGNGITVLCKDMANRSVHCGEQVVREISPAIYEYVNLMYLSSPKLSEITNDVIGCFKKAILEES